MKKIIVALILVFLILPVVSADIVTIRIFDSPSSLILLFGLTIIIEYIVYIIAIRKNYWKLLGFAALINLITFPFANWFYSWINMFWLIEFFVFLLEFGLIILLMKVKWQKALIISLIANLITTLLSFVSFGGR